jgi:hypothetical protein
MCVLIIQMHIEQVEQILQQSRMHSMQYRRLADLQITGHSNLGGSLWCDSTGNYALKHFHHPDINALINIQKCLMLPKSSAALF